MTALLQQIAALFIPYDYNVGDKSSIWNENLANWSLELLDRVHTNGTLTIRLSHPVIERSSLCHIKPDQY